MVTETQHDGPTLREYTEKRFELLVACIEKMEKNVNEKFEVNRQEREAYRKILGDRFTHVQEIVTLAQSEQKRAVDKQETAQNAHNVATNESHKTINQLMATAIRREEFERWVTEFSNYRLAASSAASSTQGERRGAKETRETSMQVVGMVGAAVGAVASIIVSIGLAALRPTPQPTPSPPQVVVVPAAPAPAQQTPPQPATR